MEESARLRALLGYAVLDTPPEPNFDRITCLAATIFDKPLCTLSLADAERHWFKSRYGVSVTEMPRRMSFCDVTVNGDTVFVVPDARSDSRFASAPIVVGPANIRFYAGAPLISLDGARIGSLCVLDTKPHTDFDEKAKNILAGLACTCVELLEARSRQVELAERTAQIADLARHDPLTGLANRRLLRHHMEDAMAGVHEEDQIAVLYLDLDHFKEVNDALGHDVGDALLLQVAERLRANVRVSDEVARIGGDEFAVVQSGAQARKQAKVLATRLIRALSAAYEVEGQTLKIGASIGIAVGTGNLARPDELLRNADQAMYAAKSAGRGTYCFFDPSMRTAAGIG